MQLVELLQSVQVLETRGDLELAVSALTYHTDAVVPGALFVALRGARVDGHVLAGMAVQSGAGIVVVEEFVDLPGSVTQVRVADTRQALAQLSNAWFAAPSRHLCTVGVTGTNGKTTLTYLLESIWRAAGVSSGVLGTIDYHYNDIVRAAPTTTPQSYELQAMLREMADQQVQAVAMEVSSHGLTQSRVAACDFDGAIFTNLSQDHLDYHATMEEYAAAKELLFTECLQASGKSNPFAVLNIDDPVGRRYAERSTARVMTYGLQPAADVYPQSRAVGINGTQLELVVPDGVLALESPLVGEYNIYNVMAAVAAGIALGVSHEAIARGIADMPQVPGRLERVAVAKDVSLFVDYAHTPDALHAVLQALRPLCPARLITVMGCGGDRDVGKRPLMGQAAAQHSDLVVVTSDNPRTEDPAQILDAIEPGVIGADYVKIVDRAQAIYHAIDVAEAGDVIVVAGKGHEDYQILGQERIHFDDREVARSWKAAELRVAL